MANGASLSIAVSFGGTKIAVAIVDASTSGIVCRTARIEWRDDPAWSPATPLGSLLDLVANHASKCLDRTGLGIADTRHVGLAWPGPGRYSEGMLEATFVPGCETSQPVHELMLRALRDRCGCPVGHLGVTSRLDVSARAVGELRMPRGAVHAIQGHARTDTIVLNIATGIAGCIVRNGSAMSSMGGLGETYGQWGRYLLKDDKTGDWSWSPTADGSVPEHDLSSKVRFTRLCGGPALARRFAESPSMRSGVTPELAETAQSLLGVSGRHPGLERAVLETISRHAYANGGSTRGLVVEAGHDVGAALGCLYSSLGMDPTKQAVVLTGGIGEFFGAPPTSTGQLDLFVDAIGSALGTAPQRIVRSKSGLDAELVGAVA